MAENSPTTSPDQEAAGIAAALIRARSERGLSQAQLAELAGVSRSAIKGYETGRNMPGARELRALCKALSVSPTVLLYGSEDAFAALVGEKTREPAYNHVEAVWQLHSLAKFLTADEVAAMVKIARAVAVARRGVEAVEASLSAGTAAADLITKPEHAEDREALGRFVEALDQEERDSRDKTAPE